VNITGETFTVTLPASEEYADLPADVALECVAAIEVAIARFHAAQIRLVGRFDQIRDGDRTVPEELAPALGGSRRAAERTVGVATELLTRLPCTLAAMERGEIGAHKAGKITDVTMSVPDDPCRHVDADLGKRVAGRDATQIRRIARNLVHKYDGPGANERAEKSREDRRLALWHEDDAMATLAASIPAETASAIYSRVDAIARTLRQSGEERTLEQLRADVFSDILLGKSTGHRAVQGTIFLHIPIGTALGITEHGCTLEGHGPVPGAVGREIMNDPTSIWRTVFTDTAGVVRDVGRTRRRPPAALAELIRVRDRECRMPACHRPAHHSEIDHARPWRSGGTTDAANLHSLCRSHNLLKEKPGWHFDHNPDTGELTVTTPAGRTYVEKSDDQPN
jgi:hypothetical protein